MKQSKEFAQLVDELYNEAVCEFSFTNKVALFDPEIVFDYFYQKSLDAQTKSWRALTKPLRPDNYTPMTHKLLGDRLVMSLEQYRGCVTFLERSAGAPPRNNPEDMEHVARCFTDRGELKALSLYRASRSLLLEAGFSKIATMDSHPFAHNSRWDLDTTTVTEIWSLGHKE